MTSSDTTIRPAARSDVTALNDMYNPYIVDSHMSFETEPWSDAERLAWFEARVAGGYPILVAEEDSIVVGAAWAGPWRLKSAYDTTVETSIVVSRPKIGSGLGTRLYSALLEQVEVCGFHRCYAVVALPNDVSLALHRNLGFAEVGVLDEVGYKDGRFISTMLLELKVNT